ncbi:MAG: A/G-specific adenine glycosylase [Bacteroidales bacterium]|nr:A/G-specific adenine glycosylase [Bacteroidales bacterium]
MVLTQQLIKWYENNKRELPWRQTKNPYFIWISEIILQQTRVIQGTDYYLNFIEKFPDVKSLALAKEDEVLSIWQGLGYYSRARNLHTAAKQIYFNLNGTFPSDYDELLKIKGIGPYTAAAIASLVYNKKVPAIDGNVYRVLSRLFGLLIPIDTAKAKKAYREAALELIDNKKPGTSNQAFIELGAMICTPFNPKCNKCPISDYCYAYSNNKVTKFPPKKKVTKTRDRYFYYLYIIYKNKIAIRKRTENDIWKSLYEFPLIETQASQPIEDLMKNPEWAKLFKERNITITQVSKTVKHILSHQIIYGLFIHIRIDDTTLKTPKDWIFISPTEISKYAFPVLITKHLKSEALES